MERSKNKMRPSLPRASDLVAVEGAETDAKPTGGRAEHGHFAPGNEVARGAGFTFTVRKSLGTKASSEEASGETSSEELVVARDAWRIFAEVLVSLESDAAPVRALLTVYARHQALHGFFTVKAEQAGLDTPRGLELLGVADRQSQRAERVLVTCHDIARVHAERASKKKGPVDVDEANRRAEEETGRKRDRERREREGGAAA